MSVESCGSAASRAALASTVGNNTLMESTVGWAQTKLRFINRRAVKPGEVGSIQNAKPVSTQTAIISDQQV